MRKEQDGIAQFGINRHSLRLCVRKKWLKVLREEEMITSRRKWKLMGNIAIVLVLAMAVVNLLVPQDSSVWSLRI
jgi:hypothetical protein